MVSSDIPGFHHSSLNPWNVWKVRLTELAHIGLAHSGGRLAALGIPDLQGAHDIDVTTTAAEVQHIHHVPGATERRTVNEATGKF